MEHVRISTRLGEVEGLVDGDVLAFRGLRYAEAPTGPRRFLPPVPSGPWEGVYDATEFGNQAMQLDMASRLSASEGEATSAIVALLSAGGGAIDEDCLFLNVHTPAADRGSRPVLVWIHGGSHTGGTANSYDGSVLAAQGDVVVVAINYRLGMFGYLDLSDYGDEFAGSPSNGFRDQILALQWVRDNIADYGGDPGNVTIFGESAGGVSVLTLLAAPSADGLYHKAIAHSGAPFTVPPSKHTTVLEGQLGVSGKALVDKLRALSAEELLQLQTFSGFSAGTMIGVDGVVITRSPLRAIAERGAGGVPLIAGWNKDEGTLFTKGLGLGVDENAVGLNGPTLARLALDGADPAEYLERLKADPASTPADRFERIWHDLFHWGSVRPTLAASKAGPGGWAYRFDYPTTVLNGVLGATHGADIGFTFNAFRKPGAAPMMFDANDSVAADVALRWSNTIIAFARTGNPNGAGLPDWPRYDTDRQLIVLDDKPRIETDQDYQHPTG